MPEHLHLEISTASILRIFFILVGFVLLYMLREVLIIVLFAIIIASAVSPFITWLERKGIPRLLGALLLYIVVFGLVILVVSMVVPSVSADISQLTSVFPKIVAKLSSSLDSAQSVSPKYFDFVGEIQNFLDFLSSYLQQVSQSAFSLVISIFGGIFSFLAIIVISFYLSFMKRGVEAFLESVAPKEYKQYAISLWKRAEFKVGRWLQGQVLLSLIVGLLVYVGLSILKVKFALMFGLLFMVLEIIPVAGPVLAAIPGILLGFIDSPSMGIWIMVFYVAVQQFENHVLVPIVLGKTTGLNPVVVILALLIGSKLAGVSGAILAVPVATVLVEVFNDLAKEAETADA